MKEETVTYELKVEMEELRLIAAGLNELPVKTGAAALLQKLQRQVTEQERGPAVQEPPSQKSATEPRGPRPVPPPDFID